MSTSNAQRMTLGLAIALAVISSIFVETPVRAADSMEEMTLSPTEKHAEVSAGDTISGSFTLLNSGQVAYDFITYSSPYFVTSGSYTATYDADAPRSDAFKWVQIDKTQWHANVRETISIPYTIHVPSNAAPGGHYGVIFAETKPPADASGIVRKKRIGMILYINVRGQAIVNGGVSKIVTKWFYSRPPIEVEFSAEDKGNTDFIVSTKMVVSDVFGGKKYETTNQYNILPGTQRDMSLAWNEVPWFGIYKVHAEATALGKTTTKDAYVLISPYWLFLLLGIGILLGGIDVLRRRRQEPPAMRRHR